MPTSKSRLRRAARSMKFSSATGNRPSASGERKVIARLLSDPPHVLAAGGGAFIDEETRQRIKESAVSIWLRAPLDLLHPARGAQGHPAAPAQYRQPSDARSACCASASRSTPQADIVVESDEGPHDVVVKRIVAALDDRGRSGGSKAMTTSVPVSLGERSYHIHIGERLIESAGALLAPPRGHIGRAAGSGHHRRDGLEALLLGVRGEPHGGGSVSRPHRAAARRTDQELHASRTGRRFAPERQCRARLADRGAGRRRDRRSDGFRRRRGEARHRFRAGADDAARPGRFLGRRQDRDQHGARQEPGRAVSSAPRRDRRHGRAQDATAARAARRLRRGREIWTARR